jgi:hypothetical protein
MQRGGIESGGVNLTRHRSHYVGRARIEQPCDSEAMRYVSWGGDVMAAEGHTELSLERCTQLKSEERAVPSARIIEAYDVVEELAREAFQIAVWEALAPEDLLRAWYMMHPRGK